MNPAIAKSDSSDASASTGIHARAGVGLLAALAVLAILAACATPPSPGSPRPPLPAASPYPETADGFAERQRRFLEIAYRQMQRHARRGEADGQRWAAGALVAAMLATDHRAPATSDAARWAQSASDAARWAQSASNAERWANHALDACGGHWAEARCQHAQLFVQRLAWEHAGAFPPALAARLRAASRLAPRTARVLSGRP